MQSNMSYNDELIAWRQGQKKARRASKVVKTRIILTLLLAGPISALSTPDLGLSCFIFLAMGIGVSVIAGLIMRRDYTRRFNAVMVSETLLEINEGKGGSFWALLQDLCAQMDVDFSRIDVRLATRNYDVGPSVIEQEERTFLVMPLGFFKLLEADKEAARAILAHELAHVCQGDTKLWLLSESYLTAIKKFLMPLAILMSTIGLIALSYTDSNMGYYDVAVARRRLLADAVQLLAQPILLLAFVYSVKKLRQRSEELADLAGIVFAGPSSLLRALAPYYAKGLLSPEGGVFSSHPKIRERTRRIQGYEFRDRRRGK